MRRRLAAFVVAVVGAATTFVGAPAASAVTTLDVVMACVPAASPPPSISLTVAEGDLVRVDRGDCARVTANQDFAVADPLLFTVTAAGAAGAHATVFTGEAEDGAVGYSVDFAPANPAPASGDPSAPAAVSGVPGAELGSVDLTVTAGADGGPVDEFVVQYRETPAGAWTDATAGAPFASTSITVIGLTPGVAYDFQVAAKNAVSTSAFVTAVGPVVATTAIAGAPDAPASVTGKRGGAVGTIALTVKPATTGGAVDEYIVQYRVATSKEWLDYSATSPITSTTIVVRGLTPGAAYDLQVAARNGIATSKFTATEAPVAARDASTFDANAFPDTEKAKPATIDSSLRGQAAGPVSVMLELAEAPATTAFVAAEPQGVVAANAAGQEQQNQVETAQAQVHAELLDPATQGDVLFNVSNAYAGVAVSTDASRLDALAQLPQVTAIHKLTPKSHENFETVPFVRSAEAWASAGKFTGNKVTVGIIDTGIDYTHADFGGPGTTEAFTAAQGLVDPWAVPTPLIDVAKVAGGYDFAGDDYNGDNTPTPDPNPLDCNGHGTHVAGTTGGYGVNANGSTYTGPWDDTNVPFDTMRIGPGVAPEVQLYALRVFGCDGPTNLVTEALDWAVDPNGDGNFADHLDVVNMSLGSSYGSSEDPDAIASNNAVDLGVVVVASAGNSDDIYQVSGSPGNAVNVISVAASDDSTDVLDGFTVTIDGGAPVNYPASQSVAYPWATGPGVTDGNVVRIGDWSQPPSNSNPIDGCSALSEADSLAIDGNVVVLAWDPNDNTRRCGSAGRTNRVAAAGATGAILASDELRVTVGITGAISIPAVLTTNTGADALITALNAALPVTATLTNALHNSERVVLTGADDPSDEMGSFSSRGGFQQGLLKPDVSAPGVTIFSAAVGTGNEGLTESGTSMAAPHVAGLAALAIQAHPTWSPSEIKAVIMNTAGHDLYFGPAHTPPKYDAMRSGAGRIDAKSAVDAQALVYSADVPGAVSVSFGVLDVTSATTVTRNVRIADKRSTGSALTYDLSVDVFNSLPGASFSLSQPSVTLGRGEWADVEVRLDLDPALLLHKPDPTINLDPFNVGLMRDYLTDISALLLAKPTGGEALRVPLIAAPRPASTLAGPASVSVSGPGATQSGTLTLNGTGVNNQSPDAFENVTSRVSALGLTAENMPMPSCGISIVAGCVTIPDDRAADIQYFGFTSDAPVVAAGGGDPLAPGSPAMAYFGVSTWGPWMTASNVAEFDIYLDTDRDGSADLVVYNTRFTGSDLLVTSAVSLRPGDGFAEVTWAPTNNTFGDQDTAKMHTDVLTLPVYLSDLANPGGGLDPFISTGSTAVDYWVESFSNTMGGVVDTVGSETSPLTVDLVKPRITAFDGTGFLPAVEQDGSTLAVTYTAGTPETGSPKVLLLHHLNATGDRAQLVTVSTPTPTPDPSPEPTPTPTPTPGPVNPPKSPDAVPPTGFTPGQSGLLIGGAATPIRVTDGPLARGIFATGGGLNLLATGIAPDGALLPADVNGALVLARSGQLRVTGTGFAPGSTATLTLSSDPITLGSATVDSSGALSALVPVPSDVAVGDHTLNLIARSADGQQAIATFGVRVLTPAAAKGARPVITVRPVAVASGQSFTVRARGVQAQCRVKFSVPGSSAKVTASAGGLASGSLTAPSSTGRRTVTARVSGSGCEPVTATTTIRVTRS